MRTFSDARLVHATQVAVSKPTAMHTAEVTALLPNTAGAEAAFPIYDFTGPVIIVGFHPTIIAFTIGDPALVVPDLKDVIVSLEVNRSERFTQAEDSSGIIQAVTLEALDSRFCDHWIELTDKRATVALKARWKLADPTRYESALISIAMYFQAIDPDTVR